MTGHTRDVWSAAWRGIRGRWRCSLGVALPVAAGAALATLIAGALAASGGAVGRRFAEAGADLVAVTPLAPDGTPGVDEIDLERIRAHPATVHAVGFSRLDATVSLSDAVAAIDARLATAPVLAVDVDIFDVLAVVPRGRAFTTTDRDRCWPVVVVGAGLADVVVAVPDQRSVFLDGELHVVVGVLEGATGVSAIDGGVLVPRCRRDHGGHAEVVVRARPGAGARLAATLPRFVGHGTPAPMRTEVHHDLDAVRGGVGRAVDGLGVAVVGATVVACGCVTAASHARAVRERRVEIGLRRALGTTRLGIAATFVVEAVVLGSGGAVAGTAVGVVLGTAVQALAPDLYTSQPTASSWVAVMLVDVAVVAAMVPAWRAGQLDPAAALRDAG